MTNDTVADVLARIGNAHNAGHRSLKIPRSKQAEAVLKVLASEGFIQSFQAKPVEGKSREVLEVWLKYYNTGEPLITHIERVSRSGRRQYRRATMLPRVRCGLGMSIISTSQGVMSDREARRRKIGGEVLAIIG